MPTERKHYFYVADGVWRKPWTNDELAALVRLMAMMNEQRARDNLQPSEAARICLTPAMMIAITGRHRADSARVVIDKLATIADIVVNYQDGSASIFWPNLLWYQRWVPEVREESARRLPHTVSDLRSPSPSPKKQKPSRDGSSLPEPAVPGLEVQEPTPKAATNGDPPEEWREVYAKLKSSNALNHPKMFNWAWWDKLDEIYKDNHDLDFLHQIALVDEWAIRYPARMRAKKDLQRFFSNWLKTAANGG